jgi:hypothetical protein
MGPEKKRGTTHRLPRQDREYAMLPHQSAHPFADPTQCRPGHIRKVKYGQWAAEARQVSQAILHPGGLW